MEPRRAAKYSVVATYEEDGEVSVVHQTDLQLGEVAGLIQMLSKRDRPTPLIIHVENNDLTPETMLNA